MISKFHFVTKWQVRATVDEVAEILADPMGLATWWPSVYLSVRPSTDSEDYDLITKGWLPYLLRWRLSVVDNSLPVQLTVKGTGDLDGLGVWTLYSLGDLVNVTFEWEVEARQPMMRVLSPVLGPVFAANHRWAMAQGEESLRLELMRRRASRQGATTAIPAPPQATWPHAGGRRLQVG